MSDDVRDGLNNCVGRVIYQKGLSDGEVAALVGMSLAQLNRIRNGRVVPRVTTAIALAVALDCRVKDLFLLSSKRR